MQLGGVPNCRTARLSGSFLISTDLSFDGELRRPAWYASLGASVLMHVGVCSNSHALPISMKQQKVDQYQPADGTTLAGWLPCRFA